MSFAFMAFMPSALQFYFVATGLFGLGQTYLINSNVFRTWMSLSIAQKPTNGPKYSAVTQSTESKGLRQLLERLEKEKAAQEKARTAIPVSPAQEDVKISFIDRIYQKFGKPAPACLNQCQKPWALAQSSNVLPRTTRSAQMSTNNSERTRMSSCGESVTKLVARSTCKPWRMKEPRRANL